MNVREITKAYLKENSFDGLFNTDCECSCLLNDLMPCSGVNEDCQPGYKKPCDCEGTPCNFHVTAEK